MKFEHINGTLCRMVEPEPLLLDSKIPCVVRPVKDNTQMGKLNQRIIYSGLRITDGVFLLDKYRIDRIRGLLQASWGGVYSYEHFEIIGYPVVEGSAEWALYQLGNDKSVQLPNRVVLRPSDFYSPKEALEVVMSSPTGWSIYDPELPKEPAYAAGDWVEFNPGNNTHQVRIVKVDGEKLHYIDEKGYQTHIYISAILRKLKPSEVRVKIALEGTVRKSQLAGCFVLDTPLPGNDVHTIRFADIDPATASLVRELLEGDNETAH